MIKMEASPVRGRGPRLAPALRVLRAERLCVAPARTAAAELIGVAIARFGDALVTDHARGGSVGVRAPATEGLGASGCS
jgi:hypothetical protein